MGIENFGCVSIDNAIANNVAVKYLNKCLSIWNGQTLLNGEFVHMFSHFEFDCDWWLNENWLLN